MTQPGRSSRIHPSETRQMAEDEQRGFRSGSNALGILLLVLGVAAVIGLYLFTR